MVLGCSVTFTSKNALYRSSLKFYAGSPFEQINGIHATVSTEERNAILMLIAIL